VLVSISIIVTVPVSEEVPEDAVLAAMGEDFLSAVGDRLAKSVADFENEPWFQDCTGVHYHYLSGESFAVEKNVGRCTLCRRCTTDMNAPDAMALLTWGKRIDGQLICNECSICHGIKNSADIRRVAAANTESESEQ
jgi:hypothetical protein